MSRTAVAKREIGISSRRFCIGHNSPSPADISLARPDVSPCFSSAFSCDAQLVNDKIGRVLTFFRDDAIADKVLFVSDKNDDIVALGRPEVL